MIEGICRQDDAGRSTNIRYVGVYFQNRIRQGRDHQEGRRRNCGATAAGNTTTILHLIQGGCYIWNQQCICVREPLTPPPSLTSFQVVRVRIAIDNSHLAADCTLKLASPVPHKVTESGALTSKKLSGRLIPR